MTIPQQESWSGPEESLNCPSCGQPNRTDAQFCGFCGARTVVVEVPVEESIDEVASRRVRIPRPGLVIVGAATAVLLGLIAILALLLSDGDEPQTRSSLNFAVVRRTDVVSVRSFDGEIAARGEGPRVIARLGGTITQLAASGQRVERGEPLYFVDGAPVVLLYGSLPAFRDLGGPDESSGPDVKQLEQNLEALGFAPGDIDERYDTNTKTAVDRWLQSLGLPPVGVVRLGRVVFAPAALTIAEHLKAVGAPVRDGDEVLSTLSSEKVVSVRLASKTSLEPGEKVFINIPTRDVTGRVISVDPLEERSAPTTEKASAIATIVADDPATLADLKEAADVDIEVPRESRKGVLAVPVTALLARPKGGYAVEVRRGGGRIELVAVKPGLYGAQDLVEVEGDLREGDRVVVP